MRFKDLGLVIIDEEQRFGVRQKEALKKLRAEVDLLTLTATPIPRTLNMAMSGLRDLSIIATPPAHRMAIKTFIGQYDSALVRLEHGWQRILEHGAYAAPLAALLGETVAASALFTSTIKFEGRLSIHLRDSGALRLLFADCTHDGHVRGIVRWDGTPPQAAVQLDPAARLAITIENTTTDSRYQGLVPVQGTTLAQAFQGYFERSEQLPTRIMLASAANRCGGILLQQIAGAKRAWCSTKITPGVMWLMLPLSLAKSFDTSE